MNADASASIAVSPSAFIRGSAEMGSEKAPSVRRFACGDLLRRTGGDDAAAGVAALGAQVDHVIGGLDDVEVVLDREHGVARVDEAIQALE